jgi:hypothetical protein
MDLSGMRTAVRYRLGVPSTDSFYTDAILTECVNEANRWIAAQWDWPWLEKFETLTTVNGTATVTPAADYSATIAVVDATGVPLVRVPIDELQRMGTGTAGVVRFFCVLAGTLHFRPVPNGNLSPVHYYRAAETALVNTSDVPLMPAQYHEAIVEAATAVALERRGSVVEAVKRREYAQAWIENMRARADRYSESTGGGAQPEGQDK